MAVDALSDKIITTLMPPSYKYLLWSASTNSSLFNLSYVKKTPKKNQKYLIYEEQQKAQQYILHRKLI